jgi:UDP-glucose 4-epimerase
MKENINLSNAKNIEVRRIDWGNENSMIEACKDIDVVIHAAGMNFEDCEKNPLLANQFNGDTTNMLIKSAISQNVKKFIYISTVHVYATPLVGIFNDESIPKANHIYATSHLMGENHLKVANNQNQISCKILRVANTFGEPVNKNANDRRTFIDSICFSAIKEKSITINSFAGTKRDFIPVSFAVNQIANVIENYSAINQEIVNIASGKSRSLETIANKVVSKLSEIKGSKKLPAIKYLAGTGTGQELTISNTQKNLIESLSEEEFDRGISDLLNAIIAKE